MDIFNSVKAIAISQLENLLFIQSRRIIDSLHTINLPSRRNTIEFLPSIFARIEMGGFPQPELLQLASS